MCNRCTTPRPLTDVHQTMANNLQLKAFSYSSCADLYGSPKSDPNRSIRLSACTMYTKHGGPVVPCTPGVRLPDRLRMFTRPCQTICSERRFRTAPVRICKALRSRTRTAQLGCVCTNYKKIGRVCCTLHTRCTTPSPLTDVHQTIANNLQLKAFLYTSCTDLYGSPNSDSNSSIRLSVCTKYTKLGGLVVPCTPGARLLDR